MVRETSLVIRLTRDHAWTPGGRPICGNRAWACVLGPRRKVHHEADASFTARSGLLGTGFLLGREQVALHVVEGRAGTAGKNIEGDDLDPMERAVEFAQ